MRRIIASAPEPFGTIVAVTAVLGLRIGETLALRKSDVDFAKRVIRVRQSVDAATRTVGGVKSNASSADLPMSRELEARLRKLTSHGMIAKRTCSSSTGGQAVLGEQTAGKTTASASGCARYPPRRIPFDETWRSEFPLGGRRNSGRCASAAPSF